MENGTKSLDLRVGGGGRPRSCLLNLPFPPKLLSWFWTKQEEHFGGIPPALSPVPYQGFLLASLASCWALTSLDGSILCLGQSEANLGCYTSHTKTVLGPLDLIGV